jgi:hypothetical protein
MVIIVSLGVIMYQQVWNLRSTAFLLGEHQLTAVQSLSRMDNLQSRVRAPDEIERVYKTLAPIKDTFLTEH